MAIVVSMLNLVPGGMGGSETYARELLGEVARSDLDASTLVAPVAAGFSGLVPEQVAPEYRTGRSDTARARGLALGLLRRRSLARRTAHASVIHFPFSVAVPAPGPGQASLVSVLDMQHHDLPELFTRLERAYRRLAYDRSALKADAVVTISHFAKERVVHHLGLDPGRVHVAHLGVRPEEFKHRNQAREMFLLYPARAWPHKNHRALFAAFSILRRRNPSLRLVLTGAGKAQLPPVPDGVEVRGQVGRSTLVALYAKAGALVFPSRYEGFGLPIIEAMSSGCPVAAAAAGSLPEVAGDAAVLFDPLDVEDMASAVEAAMDRALELQARGLERAALFSWRSCADAHLQIYRALGG